MSDRISIIIPVYGVEKYIVTCLLSVLKQSYLDLEVVLIDDGSLDNGGWISDSWIKRDDRICVIHKKNGGLSEARNYGIAISTGDYVVFVDSDDTIASEMVECLYHAIEKSGTHMGMCWLDKVTIPSKLQSAKEVILSKEEYFAWLSNLKYYGAFVTACGKMYSRKLFRFVRFPVGKLHEDQYTIHKIVDQCEKIAVIPEVYYYVTDNPDSITRSKVSIKRLDDIEALYNRLRYFEEKGYKDYLSETTEMMIWAYTRLRPKINPLNAEECRRCKDIKKMMKYAYYKYSKEKRMEELLCIDMIRFYQFLERNRIRKRIITTIKDICK